jgi:hypothetical protein
MLQVSSETDLLHIQQVVTGWKSIPRALLFGCEELPKFPADCGEFVRVTLNDGKLAKLQPSFLGCTLHFSTSKKCK